MSDQYALRLHVEQLEDGSFLATSEELSGLVAQGRTVQEAVEIAQDVARRLIESCRDHGDPVPTSLRQVGQSFDIEIPISA
jgi:predicted RNase H-like HicB family nuclease